MRIINNAFIKFISACFFHILHFFITLLCKRAHIVTEQFDNISLFKIFLNYKNYKEKKTQNLLLTIHLQNTEKSYRIQKKGCLVVFNTMKLFTFPKYKILTDTRYNRDKIAKSVKAFLSSLEQSKDQREKVLDEEYNLNYLIQLLKGKHCYHNTGKAVGISEPLDPRVTDFIKKLIRSGCR